MDILQELKIEQARRNNEATTASQKIAANTNAYTQAEKVKEQRQINALRQKSADLQVQAIGQEQSAKRDLVKAGEEISRQQKLRALSRDIYLDMLSQGQYDQNVLSGLGITEEAAKGIVAKINAAKAAKTRRTTTKKSSEKDEVKTEETTITEPTSESKQTISEAAEQLAGDAYATPTEAATIVTNKLLGLTDQGIENRKNTADYQNAVKTAMIVEIQTEQGVDRKTAETVYNLNAAAEKHGRDKVYETVLKYAGSQEDIYTFAYSILESRATAAQKNEPIKKLSVNERAVLEVMKKDEKITDEGRQLIDAVLHNDLVSRVSEYKEYLEGLDDEKLKAELQNPSTSFGLEESSVSGLAYSEYWKRNPDEYNVWILTETGEKTDAESITARKQAATAVENKIAQIDGEIASLEHVTSGDDTALGPGPHYADPGKYQELKAERDYYQNILNKYRHSQQINDENFLEYATREDYAEKSSNRDIKNPTQEDIDKFQVMAYGGTITDRETGETTIIKNTPKDYDVEAERKKLEIKDPLGFYLSMKTIRGARYDRYTYGYNGGGDAELTAEKIHAKPKSQSWDQLEEPEIGMYYYILNDQGKEKAVEYLESLATELNYRATEEHREALKKAGAVDLALLNVLSVPANVLGGVVSFVDNMAHTLTGKEINPYNGAHSMQNFASNVRGETAGRIAEATNNVNLWGFGFDDAYQAVMSGVDSLAATLLGGPKVAGVVLGTGAASSMARDLYERGATNEQILFGSVAAGAIEMITEKIGLDNLFKIKNAKTPKQWASNALKQALPEAGEEMLSEISNTVVDAVNMRSNSEWAKLVEENDGSVSKALVETAKQVFSAGAGGFLSGGMMGGVGSAPSYVKNQKTFAAEGRRVMALKLDNMVLQAGLEIGKDAKNLTGKEIGKLASEIKSRIGHGKMTAANVRALGRLKLEVAQYNYVRRQTVRGVKLNEIIKTVAKNGFFSANEVRKIYKESKQAFANALPTKAKESYNATGIDVAAQNAWLRMYDAGRRGEKVSFNVDGLTPAHAKAAYNFGAAAVDGETNTLYNKTTNGGMNYGSENTQTMGETGTDRRNDGLWQQGDDSQGVKPRLDARASEEEGNGRTWRGYSKSAGGWLAKSKKSAAGGLRVSQRILGDLRRKRLSNKDTNGRTLTPAQRKKYVNTVLKDENGNLIAVYHWTDKVFDTFVYGDIGYHFGTAIAATEHRDERVKESKTGKSIFKEAYLNIQNPVLLYFDAVIWDAKNTAYELYEVGILSKEEIAQLQSLDGYDFGGHDCEALVALRQMLADKGYDGIVYYNESEDAGSLSVIAFYPDQIEIVQDMEETEATARVPEAVATELYYAGLNGARIETAVDLSTVQGEEMRRAVQAIYDRGAAERRELGTEQGIYRAGKGKVINRTDHWRSKPKTDVELLRKFARTHRLDVEIHEDGSIEGEAAYDVAAFKILMGESTEQVDFYHEVFENMQAIHPAAFNELRDAMVEHFLESGTFSQFNDEITQTMRRYDTDDYALARKEWVCGQADGHRRRPTGLCRVAGRARPPHAEAKDRRFLPQTAFRHQGAV